MNAEPTMPPESGEEKTNNQMQCRTGAVVVGANRRPVVGEHGLTIAGLPPACLHAPYAIHVGLHFP
jgi:hypothetical protein